MSEKRKQEARGRDDEPESSAPKKAKTEEEEEEAEEGDSDGDSEEEAVYSGELPSSEEDDDDDEDDDIDEEELSDGGGAIIEGLEVDLKKMDDGKYLLLEKDDLPKELKLVIPSTMLPDISKWCKEKFAEGCIPVLDAKDIEVVTDIEEELVCHAEILEVSKSLDKSDKEMEQALKEDWTVVRIEGYNETFGTLYFAFVDEAEGEQ